jgi:hypothetical protein
VTFRGRHRPDFFFAFGFAFFGACFAGVADARFSGAGAAGFAAAADFSSSRWRCSLRANFASRMARN